MRDHLRAWAVVFVLSAPDISDSRAQAYQEVDVADGGVIVGTVTFNGTPPGRRKLPVDNDEGVCARTNKYSKKLIVGRDGGVKNAVVRLMGIERGKKWSDRKYVLDQKDCVFDPHVLVVPTKTGVEILNRDNILHMVRIHAERNPPWNLAQPKFKQSISKTFDVPEVLLVSCDVHRWMSAYIIVAEHPYYAVSDEKGRFALEDVPPGEHQLLVWHESLAPVARRVRVEPGGELRFDVEMTR